jgi:hypothetical protein
MGRREDTVADTPKANEATRDRNPDPLTGASGAHPIGVGVGATGAAAAGAAVGATAGPVGAAVGTVVGAIAGGLFGKGVAEGINPTVEDEFWAQHHASRPYAGGRRYEVFRPAYQYGWESHGRFGNRNFDEAEPDLRTEWEASAFGRELSWEDAREATRDAWTRIDERRRETRRR